MKRIFIILCFAFAVMLPVMRVVTSFAADDAVDAVISQIDAIGEVKYQVRTEAGTRSALKLTNILRQTSPDLTSRVKEIRGRSGPL